MKIQDAIRIAMEEGKYITRNLPFEEPTLWQRLKIEPTDRKDDGFIIHDVKNGNRARLWNPQVADILADDWVVVF